MNEFPPLASDFKDFINENYPFDKSWNDNQRLQYWDIIIQITQELRSGNLGDLRCLPRPKTSPLRGKTTLNNKYSKWRQKMRETGRCPKCGKECAPFYECSYHRFTTFMRKMVKKGHLIKKGIGEEALYKINTKAVKHKEVL